MAYFARRLGAVALLALATGCGTTTNTPEATNPSVSVPVTTLEADIIGKVACGEKPQALDLNLKKHELTDFVKLQLTKPLAKGNCQLGYQPADPKVQVVVLVQPGGSSDQATWTVDASNPQDAGIGLGKDDVVYLLIHGANLDGVKTPHENLKLAPGLSIAKQAKRIHGSALYQFATATWK